MKKIEFTFLCDEDINKMPETKEAGCITRFCSQCTKNIVDFTKMKPAEIAAHLKTASKPCGFMMQWQVDELNEHFNAQRKPSPFLKYAKIAAAVSSPLLFNPVFGQRNTNTAQTVNTVNTEADQDRPKSEITEVLVLDSLGQGIPNLELELYDGESFIKTVKTGIDCKVYINHGEMRGINTVQLKNSELAIEKNVPIKEKAVCMIWRTTISKDEAAQIKELDFQFLMRGKKRNEKPLLHLDVTITLYDSTNALIETIQAKTNMGGYLSIKSKNIGKAYRLYFSAETGKGMKSNYKKTTELDPNTTKILFYHRNRGTHAQAMGRIAYTRF